MNLQSNDFELFELPVGFALDRVLGSFESYCTVTQSVAGAIPVCKDQAPRLIKEVRDSTGWSIRRVRTLIELTVLAAGIALGGTVGVGTVVFALTVGPVTQFFLPYLLVRLEAPVVTPAPAQS